MMCVYTFFVYQTFLSNLLEGLGTRLACVPVCICDSQYFYNTIQYYQSYRFGKLVCVCMFVLLRLNQHQIIFVISSQ